ncbi:hypothetical protein CC78DRAFT_573824 [Lojkania enalia]|uniref:NACHT domain-containing protein n=1 Tax=Lojkania enalia TaxID=147567 RepID=A0A9P4NCE4_9PLEO|nr:hypothetical protein CC78DRAFT_573824 [Didymosphaeria enalia]
MVGSHHQPAYSGITAALDEFQQVLSPDQTAQLRSFSSHAPTADDVVRLTQQVIQANASRKSRLFASRLQGLLSSVQQYCMIIDTCVGPNQIAALVWGSIKLVLLVSSNFAEYFDKLSRLVAQLSNYCPRFSEYKRLFPTSERLQQALSEFYSIVVKFCRKALGLIQEKGAKRYSKSLWKSFKLEFREIEESISEAKDEVTEELQLASEQEAQDFRRLLTAEVEENRILRTIQASEIQENKDFRSLQTLALQQSKARQIQKIMKDEGNLSARRSGFCDLFQAMTTQEAFTEHRHCAVKEPAVGFSKDQNSRTGLIREVQSTSGVTEFTTFSAQNETVVIYYFFDSSEKNSLKASTFLRSILHQTITLETLLPDSQRRLESLFESQIDQSEPATSELEQLFLHFYRKFNRAFLLIDGLDEADEVERRNVKSFLKEVAKMNGARILAITHAEMDMSTVFTRSSALHIQPEDLKDDIEVFIQSQIEKYSQDELSNCEPFILDLIKQKLIADAEGMFLWVDLQLKAILDDYEEHGGPDRIPDILEALPRKITDLYSFLLERLVKGADDRIERARRAFQWVIYSNRPLTLSELEEAISISPSQKTWQSPSSKLDISKLARLCGNLVDYDKANRTVSLAHHTVESFLLGCSGRQEVACFAIEENKAEQYIADICMTYLSFTDFHKALTRTSDTKHLHTMGYPVSLLGSIAPSFIRPWALSGVRGRRGRRRDQPVDPVNMLRTELSARQSKKTDPTFQTLEYCRSYWYDHSRYIALEDTKRVKIIENFVRSTHLRKEWIPWSSIEDNASLPFWNMFAWAVRNGHTVIFCIWKRVATEQESSYWNYLWREEGEKLFVSACESANLEQLEIMLGAKRVDDHADIL